MTETFVGFIDQKVKEEYEKAKTDNPQLFKFLERATDDLKENPFCGTKIPKNLWPKDYIRKYSINNLWKYDLPNAWRLRDLYTQYPRTKSRFWPSCWSGLTTRTMKGGLGTNRSR